LKVCEVCGAREARVFQRHSGKSLCAECFARDVVERVRSEVVRYGMFSPSERLLLALSGGKDSFVLMEVIKELHDVGKVGIVTIVEGIEGYNREEDLEWLKESSKAYGIDLHIVTLSEFLGYSLDEVVRLSSSRDLGVSPCTYCGVLRRRAINYVARLHGYDKVLTAHNLDDEVQTSLMNILRGDVARLIQNHPLSPTLSRYFVKRVKPLRKVYEWETSVYAYLRGFKFQGVECPYITSRPTLRAELRDYLYEVEVSKPGTLLRVLEAVDSYVERVLLDKASRLPELPQCEFCGSPTAYGRRLCVTCDLLSRLGILRAIPY